jgi:hypothetical protein
MTLAAWKWVVAGDLLSTDPTDEIADGVDVITAIAVAPSEPGKIAHKRFTVSSSVWFDC